MQKQKNFGIILKIGNILKMTDYMRKMSRYKCPSCNKHLSARTNIKHKDGKNFAYLCGTCGFRITFDNWKDFEEQIKKFKEGINEKNNTNRRRRTRSR